MQTREWPARTLVPAYSAGAIRRTATTPGYDI